MLQGQNIHEVTAEGSPVILMFTLKQPLNATNLSGGVPTPSHFPDLSVN